MRMPKLPILVLARPIRKIPEKENRAKKSHIFFNKMVTQFDCALAIQNVAIRVTGMIATQLELGGIWSREDVVETHEMLAQSLVTLMAFFRDLDTAGNTREAVRPGVDAVCVG